MCYIFASSPSGMILPSGPTSFSDIAVILIIVEVSTVNKWFKTNKQKSAARYNTETMKKCTLKIIHVSFFFLFELIH